MTFIAKRGSIPARETGAIFQMAGPLIAKERSKKKSKEA
jgi:hypothetical protein